MRPRSLAAALAMSAALGVILAVFMPWTLGRKVTLPGEPLDFEFGGSYGIEGSDADRLFGEPRHVRRSIGTVGDYLVVPTIAGSALAFVSCLASLATASGMWRRRLLAAGALGSCVATSSILVDYVAKPNPRIFGHTAFYFDYGLYVALGLSIVAFVCVVLALWMNRHRR